MGSNEKDYVQKIPVYHNLHGKKIYGRGNMSLPPVYVVITKAKIYRINGNWKEKQ
jgi:hypothetical protein